MKNLLICKRKSKNSKIAFISTREMRELFSMSLKGIKIKKFKMNFSSSKYQVK